MAHDLVNEVEKISDDREEQVLLTTFCHTTFLLKMSVQLFQLIFHFQEINPSRQQHYWTVMIGSK
jgi:hypothetical protein